MVVDVDARAADRVAVPREPAPVRAQPFQPAVSGRGEGDSQQAQQIALDLDPPLGVRVAEAEIARRAEEPEQRAHVGDVHSRDRADSARDLLAVGQDDRDRRAGKGCEQYLRHGARGSPQPGLTRGLARGLTRGRTRGDVPGRIGWQLAQRRRARLRMPGEAHRVFSVPSGYQPAP